ncbi:phage major capsid protein [Insolitispirillum peregrinum]|uniref:Phage capsid family protein n=1 Tax=Insolitispirillum peregrinum TaxID=80876 RepID=A0A1N7LRS9_9PROT|nr:phage major capsid protein [Insolitispirillum peregrinum]SIS76573.1 Phage capsid family protein [Insolitispirillum peregrinum]
MSWELLCKSNTELAALQTRFGATAPLVAFAKGLVGPEVLTVSGTLTPEVANAWIDLVVEHDFLKLVTVHRMARLKSEVPVLDMGRRSLRRVPQGSEPAADDSADVNQFGCTLEAEDAQLFLDLSRDFLRDNQNNPNLPTLVEGMLSRLYGAELLDLAFNGLGSTAPAGPDQKFLSLNKGWLLLLKEAAQAGKAPALATIDPATTGYVKALETVFTRLPAKYLATAVAVMSDTDALKYGVQVAGTPNGSYTAVPAGAFVGKPIVAVPYMPSGSIMVTPLENLVLGINQEMERTREYHARKRCLQYTFDGSFDFEIRVKEAAALGVAA